MRGNSRGRRCEPYIVQPLFQHSLTSYSILGIHFGMLKKRGLNF